MVFLNVAFSISIVHAQNPTDCLGAEYLEDEYIVVYHDTVSIYTRNSIRAKYGVVSYESCLCDTIELWDLGGLLPTLSPEEKKGAINSELEVESIDFNYLLGNGTLSSVSADILQLGSIPTTNRVVTAVIDCGIDPNHNKFTSTQFWKNPDELVGIQNQDDDGNCIVDDIRGYDFVNKIGDPGIETGKDHGMHVAGIINDVSAGCAVLLDLKIFGNSSNQNTLFNATCATYYAIDKKAQVINMSWGWTGMPATCLKNAIRKAGTENCALVVCSAGNEGGFVDSIPHYPSGYLLENIIEVTALSDQLIISPTVGLAAYSNRGNQVDVAVNGTWYSATFNDSYELKSGTSMAAAAVSGLAARLFAAAPSASFLDVKHCIIGTALESNGINPTDVKGSKYIDFDSTANYMNYLSNAIVCISSLNNSCPDLSDQNELCALINNNNNHPLAGLDCDNDGLTNIQECTLGADPTINDASCNAANDTTICLIISEDPNHPIAFEDCDNGGIPNYLECALGYDPQDSNDDCVIVLNETTEVCSWLLVTPNNAMANVDCDGDGVSNFYACLLSESPIPSQQLLTVHVVPQSTNGVVQTLIQWTGTTLQQYRIINLQTAQTVIQESTAGNQSGVYQNNHDFTLMPSGFYEIEVVASGGMTEVAVFEWVNPLSIQVSVAPNPTSGPVAVQIDNPFNVPLAHLVVYSNATNMPIVCLPLAANAVYPTTVAIDMSPFPVGVYQVGVYSLVGEQFMTTLIVQ